MMDITQLNELSVEELEERIDVLKKQASDFKNEEQGVKLTLNSIYGACGNAYFALFNPDVAEAVTLQGQDLVKFAEKVMNKYFHEQWHLDTELHEKLGARNVKRISKSMVAYGDTDSLISTSKILVKNDDIIEKIPICDIFNNLSIILDIIKDERGNEIIEPINLDVCNYIDILEFSRVKKIIRHKVKKPKWKIVTETGKEVIVTNDHSLTVFRGGNKITIKPSEININTDKVLEINIDI